jgi:hypothetical protein
MQPDGARSAYRKKAKETHPDFFYTEDPRVQKQQTALFRNILDAYDIINLFFKEREEGRWTDSFDTAPSNRQETHRARSSRSRPAQQQSGNNSYRAPVPFCVLEVGRYLYYTGHISYRVLIEALTWQRMQRPIIGAVALRWGWLEKTSIEWIMAASKTPGRFGEKAVRLGLLSDFQIRTLLAFQRSRQDRLGRYFILKKILTADQLNHFVQQLQEHNARVLASKKPPEDTPTRGCGGS